MLNPHTVRMVTNKMPKMIDPKTHALIDYATAGAFFVMGAMFWKKNRRAALGAMFCGAATAATSLVTDYPGGVKRMISFETHGAIDAGMAGVTATMPNMLSFSESDEAKYFRTMALAETVVAGLTDFTGDTRGKVLEMPSRVVAT